MHQRVQQNWIKASVTAKSVHLERGEEPPLDFTLLSPTSIQSSEEGQRPFQLSVCSFCHTQEAQNRNSLEKTPHSYISCPCGLGVSHLCLLPPIRQQLLLRWRFEAAHPREGYYL